MFFPFQGNTQNAYLLNDTLKTSVGFDGNYLHNSTAFTNEFIKTFYLGKFISQDIKDNVKRRLNGMNLFGQEFNASLYGIIHFDSVLHSANHNLYIGISSKSLFKIYFPKDLFTVAFYGNKDFLGDTAYFNQLRSTYYKYQSFDIGWLYQKHYSTVSLTSGIKLSIIKGKQYFDVGMLNGYLFTSNSGNLIDVGAKSVFIQSDTANPVFGGTGSSITFFTEIYASEKAKIHIEFNDIGFITWNQNTLIQSGDTNYAFTGIDLIEMINGSSSGINNDSIANYFFDTSEKKKTTTTLPAAIFVYYEQQVNEKWQLTLGLNQRLFFYYNTYFFGKINYKITPNLSPVLQLAYGGYGKLAVGLGIHAKIKHSWQLTLQTNNIEGLLLPKTYGGLSLQTGIIKQF